MAFTTLLWPLPSYSSVLVLLQLLAISSVADAKVQSVPVDAQALVKGRVSCYVCNSDSPEQANCTSTDVGELTGFVKVCPPLTEGPLAGTEANSCRKVLQNFGEENNVVRECAYTGTEPVDGKRRTGNKGIILYIYQCFNEQNVQDKPCNSAPGLPWALSSVLALVATALLLFY